MSPRNYDGISDDELWKCSTRGDQDAFAIYYERKRTSICECIFELVKDKEDANDLTQEVYLKAWDALKRTAGLSEVQNPPNWLRRIARNHATDHLRAKKRHSCQPLEYPYDLPIVGPSDPEREVTERELVLRALAAVKPENRLICLFLQDIFVFSQAEIGEEFHWGKLSVRTYISEARKQLRAAHNLLKKDLDNPEAELPKWAEYIFLHYGCDYSPGEIVERGGAKIEFVNAQIAEGRQKLHLSEKLRLAH